MAFTITITTEPRTPRRKRTAGFTLAEVLIATSISAIIMAAVLSAFLMMGRSGVSAYNYATMEGEARTALEQFGEDVRMAKDIRWTSSKDIALWMDKTNRALDVRYYYDSTAGSSTYHCFVRYGPDRVTGTVGTKVLIHDVQSDFAFSRWKKGSTPITAPDDTTTSQLQLGLTIKKTTVTVVAATNLVVSARFILRNK